MQPKLQNVWENIRSSLWFVPSLLVVLALVLSSLLIEVDVVLAERKSAVIPWIFSGTADAARTVLSVIAGSLITVISIAFSLTIIALQQAATQFSPRVLRTFTASRTNQVVLGAYTATFIYALLVLRTVRSADQGDPFVPALSVTVAVGFALICLGLLIYFIHHMSQALQVSVIIDQIRAELVEHLHTLYPAQIAEPVDDPPPITQVIDDLHGEPTCVIRSSQTGFVRAVDADALLTAPLDGIDWLWVRPQVGEFVPQAAVVAEIAPRDTPTKELTAAIHVAIVIDWERSLHQDPLFGIRQLVDIALKALSPGINDPTTAEYVLQHLGAALGTLATRQFPSPVRTPADGGTRVLLSYPTWADYVDAAFSQIRREAEDDLQVTSTLLRVLTHLAEQVPTPARAVPIHEQVAAIRERAAQQPWTTAEHRQVARLADVVDRQLRAAHAEATSQQLMPHHDHSPIGDREPADGARR